MPSKNLSLHIGIDDYHTFGPDLDLRGAVNDARSWAGHSRGLGADPTVLTDAEATRAGILAAVEALGAAVAADPESSGLVTFSGHGAAMDQTGAGTRGVGVTAAIAPFDTARDGDRVVNLVSLEELEAALGDGAANTTIVVDACYTRLAEARRPHRGLSTGPAPEGPERVASRLILGSEPWGQSYELYADGAWHGALTWAMLTLLDQWTVRNTAGACWHNVSYGDLVYRVHLQLDVFGLGQRPMCLGPARTVLLPFLRPGAGLSPDEPTSPLPDRIRPGSQLSCGNGTEGYRTYTIQAILGGTPTTVATVIVPKSAAPSPWPYTTSNEYWFLATLPSATWGSGCTGYKISWTDTTTWTGYTVPSGTGVGNWPIKETYTSVSPNYAPPVVNSLGGFRTSDSSDHPVALWASWSTSTHRLNRLDWLTNLASVPTTGFPFGGTVPVEWTTPVTTAPSSWSYWSQTGG